MGKKFDIVATIGTYEKQGKKQYINRNVGSVIETQHGLSIKLDACFNPAALPITEDGQVWLKLFEPREHIEKMQKDLGAAPQPAQQAQAPSSFDNFDDDIPF